MGNLYTRETFIFGLISIPCDRSQSDVSLAHVVPVTMSQSFGPATMTHWDLPRIATVLGCFKFGPKRGG